jgi:DNA-binding Lrp family transcriptional regulator
MPLDRIDRAIVAALQKEARLSNKELAERIGLAESSCLERVRRLSAAGVLLGFHAEVAPEALGIGLEVIVAVQVRPHARDTIEAFRAHVLALREVVSAYHVTGSSDFLVHVALRDSAHLRDFALDAFASRPEVAHMETSVIFTHHRRAGLPDLLPTEPRPSSTRRARRRPGERA